MMINKLMIVTFLLFVLNFEVFAASPCTNALRVIFIKEMRSEAVLLKDESAKQFYKKRDHALDMVTSLIGNKDKILQNKMMNNDRYLVEALKQGLIPLEITGPIRVIRDAVNDPFLIKEWIKELHQQVVLEVYAEGTYSDYAVLEIYKRLPERLIINTLVRRSIDGGFSGDLDSIVRLETQMGKSEFAEILKNKKLIIDEAFRNTTHGHLVHILQVDLMIYALKKANLDPRLVSELYQWIGEENVYSLTENGDFYHSLIHGWNGFFDSQENDLTSPELLNVVLFHYLNWTINK